MILLGGAAQDDTAYFWFFDSGNLEVVVKVLDGCFLGASWVFAAGLTHVETTLIATDTHSGVSRRYTNPQRTPFLQLQDTAAFATCP